MSWIRRATWPPALVAVLLHVAFLLPVLQRTKYDPSAMIFAAEKHRGEADFEPVTAFHLGDGYDGQFYFLIAQDPFRSWEGKLDHPVRHLRVGYPLTCHVLSAGRPQALPYVMPLVNLLCIGGVAWLGAFWASRHGQSVWWGCWLPLVTTMLASLLRDLTDPLGLLASFGVLVAWHDRRTALVIACAALTMFTREQNAFVPALVGVAALVRREWTIAAGLVAVAATWLGYVALLTEVYGMRPLMPTAGNLAAPFSGLAVWWNTQNAHNLMRFMRGTYALFMLGQVVLLAIHAVRNRRDPSCLEAVGFTVVAAACVAGPSIWEDWWSYTRNWAMLPLVVWTLNIRACSRGALTFGMISAILVYGSIRVMQ